MRHLKYVSHSILSLTIIGLMSSCTQNTVNSEGAIIGATPDSAEETKSIYNVNSYPLNKLVCNPLGGGKPNSPQSGIKATLYYLGANSPKYNKVLDYIKYGIKSDQTLFFNNVDVPTRMFSAGFPLQTGGLVKDDTGKDLIEYFALKFETIFKLDSAEEEGLYEFALLSDDGTILNIKDAKDNQENVDGKWETLVSNDMTTPTRMACATKVLDLKHNKKIPLELYYFQGPRYHIANMLIWRKATKAGLDPLCGSSGNTFFFDPVTGTPKKWNDLVSRGWKVVGAKNFQLTNSNATDALAKKEPKSDYNACYEGTAPKVTDFQILEVTPTGANLIWKTDIPTTAQVIITFKNGKTKVTESDNVLRTSHEFSLTGLDPQTKYSIQVIAISQDLGKGLSQVLTLTTF